MTTSNMSARRVSFSERISYSDDASTTTVTTDDEMYRDDGSFASDSDEEDEMDRKKELEGEDESEEEEKEEDPGEAEACKDNVKKLKTTESEGLKELGGNVAKLEGEESSFSKSSYLAAEDEEPLVFRDVGVTERPSEYLGGYGSESAGDVHRVKLRKSWLATNADDEEQSERNEFEAWKRGRAKAAAAKKKAKDAPQKNQALERAHAEEKFEVGAAESVDLEYASSVHVVKASEGQRPSKDKQKEEIQDQDEEKPKESEEAVEIQPSKTVANKAKTLKKTKAVSATKEKKVDAEVAPPAKEAKATNRPKTRIVKQPKRRDPEMEAHEKEVLELKERISSLQRQLDVAEVRTISQLADLEEETTKRMREYRAKADEIVRKQRAKNEKKALKEKVMKSQDLIDQLRKSNQKMRAEGAKMQAAIAKLRESNQSLEEKNSVHRGYATEFLSFQKIEVSIAEAMNQSLAKDIPKYEKLIRDMEDGVVDRLKSSHIERSAKELYEDCIQTMLDMLEANCSDAALMDRVAMLMEENEDRSAELDASTSSYSSATRRSLVRQPEAKPSSLKAALKNSSIKRPSRHGSFQKEDSRASTAKAVRRSKSVTAKISKEVQEVQKNAPVERRSSLGGSLRGTRTSLKSDAHVKAVQDSDDSSTCSLTSMPSVTSENFSISDYAY